MSTMTSSQNASAFPTSEVAQCCSTRTRSRNMAPSGSRRLDGTLPRREEPDWRIQLKERSTPFVFWDRFLGSFSGGRFLGVVFLGVVFGGRFWGRFGGRFLVVVFGGRFFGGRFLGVVF